MILLIGLLASLALLRTPAETPCCCHGYEGPPRGRSGRCECGCEGPPRCPLCDLRGNSVLHKTKYGIILPFIVNYSAFAKPYFFYEWSCTKDGVHFQLGNISQELNTSEEIKYIRDHLVPDEYVLDIPYIYLSNTLKCRWNTFQNISTILKNITKTFTILPTRKLKFYIHYANKTFNLNSSRPLKVTLVLSYINVMPYVYLHLYSNVSNMSKFVTTSSKEIDIWLLENVTPQCLQLLWKVFWKDFVKIAEIKDYVMLYYKSRNVTVYSNFPYRNVKIEGNLSLTCNSEGQGLATDIIISFRIDLIKYINFFHVIGNRIEYEYENISDIKIACFIYIYTNTSLGWCRLFEIGNTINYISILNYRNFTISSIDNIIFFERFYLKVFIEMNYPNIYIFELKYINPNMTYESHVINLKEIPLYNASFLFHYSNGFFQLFYTIQNHTNQIPIVYVQNFAFLDSKLHLFLNPSNVIYGSYVMCTTNSIDAIFTFEWWCMIKKEYIRIMIRDNSSAESQTIDFLSLITVQSLYFDYGLYENTYTCKCVIKTLNFSKTSLFIFLFPDNNKKRSLTIVSGIFFSYYLIIMIMWFCAYYSTFYSLMSILRNQRYVKYVDNYYFYLQTNTLQKSLKSKRFIYNFFHFRRKITRSILKEKFNKKSVSSKMQKKDTTSLSFSGTLTSTSLDNSTFQISRPKNTKITNEFRSKKNAYLSSKLYYSRNSFGTSKKLYYSRNSFGASKKSIYRNFFPIKSQPKKNTWKHSSLSLLNL